MCKASGLYHGLSEGEDKFNMLSGECPYLIDEKGRIPMPAEITPLRGPSGRIGSRSTMWAQQKSRPSWPESSKGELI
jgi:hypothetical protein